MPKDDQVSRSSGSVTEGSSSHSHSIDSDRDTWNVLQEVSRIFRVLFAVIYWKRMIVIVYELEIASQPVSSPIAYRYRLSGVGIFFPLSW
jgi:hypothetical protein